MNGYQAVVLAAGAGARFGGAKLLAPWRGRPLILAAVETALSASVDEVVVVVGCDGAAVEEALPPLGGPRLRIVHALDWREGMAASLRCGVASLPRDSRGFLLFLGDMPEIPATLPAAVLHALAGGATAVRPMMQGLPAHPVGFSPSFYPALRALTGDVGAGAILRDRADVVRLDVTDLGAVLDIDTPEDLARG